MPVVETLIDGLGILGDAVVIGDARKPTEQIGGEQQRGNYGDQNGARRDCTQAGYRADSRAHGAVPNVLGNLPGETGGNLTVSDRAARAIGWAERHSAASAFARKGTAAIMP